LFVDEKPKFRGVPTASRFHVSAQSRPSRQLEMSNGKFLKTRRRRWSNSARNPIDLEKDFAISLHFSKKGYHSAHCGTRNKDWIDAFARVESRTEVLQ
jgi:hypothetical protein